MCAKYERLRLSRCRQIFATSENGGTDFSITIKTRINCYIAQRLLQENNLLFFLSLNGLHT